MSSEFKIGDVVRMKSGSPGLVVSSEPTSSGTLALQFWDYPQRETKCVYLHPELIEHTTKVSESA